MTNIKLPPMTEPDHYAFVDGGQGIWVEGGPTGTPFYSEQQVQELMREAVRLNAQAVPDGMVLVPVDTLKRWRDAFAEELSAWDIDPPLHHVQTSHDEIEAMLSAAPAAPPPVPTPRKIEIPPPGADALDVAFAEGWNQCCDAYFGGLPPQAPLVVTVFKTNSDTAAPQPVGAVPEGYALVHVDMLKQWGVYDQVKQACVYPVSDRVGGIDPEL